MHKKGDLVRILVDNPNGTSFKKGYICTVKIDEHNGSRFITIMHKDQSISFSVHFSKMEKHVAGKGDEVMILNHRPNSTPFEANDICTITNVTPASYHLKHPDKGNWFVAPNNLRVIKSKEATMNSLGYKRGDKLIALADRSRSSEVMKDDVITFVDNRDADTCNILTKTGSKYYVAYQHVRLLESPNELVPNITVETNDNDIDIIVTPIIIN